MAPRKEDHEKESKDKQHERSKPACITKAEVRRGSKAVAKKGRATSIVLAASERCFRLLENGLVDVSFMSQLSSRCMIVVITFAGFSLMVDRSERNAAESPLLRLPAEIREKVWKCATSGVCVNATRRKEIFPTWADGSSEKVVRNASAFHLPRVCRQIYAETAVLPYASSTFIVDASDARCIAWANGSCPVYQDAITTVCILTSAYYHYPDMDQIHSTLSTILPNLRQVHFDRSVLTCYRRSSKYEVLAELQYSCFGEVADIRTYIVSLLGKNSHRSIR